MAKKRLLFPLCGLVAGSAYLTTAVPTSFVLGRPLHSLAVLLLTSGLASVAYGTWTQRGRRTHHKDRYDRYEALPLSNRQEDRLGENATGGGIGRRLAAHWRVVLAALLLLLICGRAALVWIIMKNVECAQPTYLGYLPLVLALFHAYRNYPSEASSIAGPGLSRKALLEYVVFLLLHESTRFVLPALLLGCSTSAALKALYLRSTYICPGAHVLVWMIPKLSFLGFLIDCIIVIAVYSLLEPLSNGDDIRSKGVVEAHVLTGLSLIASSVVLAVAGIITYIVYPEHRFWMSDMAPEYVRSLTALAAITLLTTLAFLHTARYVGTVRTCILTGIVSVYMVILRTFIAPPSQSFPPWPIKTLAGCMVAIILASNLLLEPDLPAPGGARPPAIHRNLRLRAVLTISIFCVAFFAMNHRQAPVPGHPIDTLISMATDQHTKWAQQAHRSLSLTEATSHYRTRYKRAPPPGFSQWFDFAKSRNSIIIDDFDNIEDDLAPYWSLSPVALRKRTAEILVDNRGLGGISIRGGKAEVFSNVPGTHRWSVDGVVRMVDPFVEHLPDMDLAINLNDEPRIAIPFDTLHEALVLHPSAQQSADSNNFSPDRAATWLNISELSSVPSYFRDTGFNPTFYNYGSVSCAPSSRARVERNWDTGNLCTTCAAVHSLGVFIRNWTLSASPCHQPDLANLHGLHLSPSALVGSHDLVPVFSQSKAFGYADIRFPSPWNYMDKARYEFDDEFPDPLFEEKENTLYWRGATSEGVSAGSGAWKGMLRQRLVHLANHQRDPQAVLLPSAKGQGSVEYIVKDSWTIFRRLVTKLDIRFVSPVVRCGGQDCPAQTEEFDFTEPVDFKQHWRYKYLFDADGAGFSGRFIPFLQSNSLVFKSALFREWYEGRLTAWHHFVPVDLRLHDLWSTVAYFGGWKGPDEKTTWTARDDQAKKIAEQGKEWTNKVLRKEDMEVYMYRLLLEWAWLTDDQRSMKSTA